MIEASPAAEPSAQIIVLGDQQGSAKRRLLGLKVQGGRGWAESIAEPIGGIVPAVGTNSARAENRQMGGVKGALLLSVIHPSATVGIKVRADAVIGAGSVVIRRSTLGSRRGQPGAPDWRPGLLRLWPRQQARNSTCAALQA